MNKLRVGFLVVCLMTIVGLRAESVLSDGMEWVNVIYPDEPQLPESVIERVVIDGDTVVNGFDCLKLYRINPQDDKVLVNVLRVEDDKIYFLPSTKSKQWLIMYDFALKPGEGCTFYAPPYYWNDDSEEYALSIKSYMKCVSVSESGDGSGFSSMQMEEFADEASSVSLGTGEWIKGIGSLKGFLNPIYLNADGYGGELLKVYNGKTLIWENTKSEVVAVSSDETLTVTKSGDNCSIELGGIGESSEVEVYSLDGTLLYHRRNTSDKCIVDIPKQGIYIVKVDQKVLKLKI